MLKNIEEKINSNTEIIRTMDLINRFIIDGANLQKKIDSQSKTIEIQDKHIIYLNNVINKLIKDGSEIFTELNKYNTIRFKDCKTKSIRITVECFKAYSAGLFELKVAHKSVAEIVQERMLSKDKEQLFMADSVSLESAAVPIIHSNGAIQLTGRNSLKEKIKISGKTNAQRTIGFRLEAIPSKIETWSAKKGARLELACHRLSDSHLGGLGLSRRGCHTVVLAQVDKGVNFGNL